MNCSIFQPFCYPYKNPRKVTFIHPAVGVAGEQVQDDAVPLRVREAQLGPRPQPHGDPGEERMRSNDN